MICIYQIINPKGKVYIGQTLNFNRRYNVYKNMNCKKQIRLYNSFLKYGFANHLFLVVEICNISNINEKERYWQEHYKVIGEYGLNCSYVNTKDKKFVHNENSKMKISIANKGKTNSIETRLKISKGNKGKKLSQDHKDLIRKINLGNSYMKGKKASEETKLKHSLKSKGTLNGMYGKKHTKETKYKISLSSKGRKHSLDSKKKMSNSRKGLLSGEKNPMFNVKGKFHPSSKQVINIKTGVIHESCAEASEFYNIPKSTLRSRLNGRLKNITDLKYI